MKKQTFLILLTFLLSSGLVFCLLFFGVRFYLDRKDRVTVFGQETTLHATELVFSGQEIPDLSAVDAALLTETYPDAKVGTVGEGSVDQGWRTHQRYYAMRDMWINNYISDSFSKYDG